MKHSLLVGVGVLVKYSPSEIWWFQRQRISLKKVDYEHGGNFFRKKNLLMKSKIINEITC